jgi:RHS repeat-associated protein
MNSPAGSRVALLCVAVILLWCHPSRGIAAPTDCIGNGGETVCGSPVYTPWTYRFVDTSCSTFISYLRTICEVWYLGNYDTNCYASPITEANMTGRAYNWAKRSLCVVETHIAQPWLAPGQTLDTGSCAHGVVRPKYTNGVETLNYRSITSSGSSSRSCDQPRGVRSVIRRERSATVNCPPGSTKRTLNGVVECTQPQEEMSCPSGDEGKPICETDNPISLGLGNKRQTETDYAAAGASPLKFTRIYNSRSYFRTPDYPEVQSSVLGEQWGSNYDRQFYAINSAYTMAIIVRPGRIIKHFAPDGREIASPTRSRERLEKILNGSGLSGWRYFTAEDTTEIYDVSGKLLSITDRRGIAQTFSYSDANTPVEVAPSAGLLIRVQDSFGRVLAFAYDGGNRLISLTDPAGNLYGYEYDAIGNLEFVNLPADSGAAVRRQYHYEHPTFKSALTGITDEHGVRYATYTYDAQGRANSSEHADGADTTTLTFGANNTTVTNALGGTRTYQFANVAGVLRNTSITRTCSDCAGNATTSNTYDASGFVLSRTDFNGRVTNYTHEARGLETSRTEAVGTPQARTITTSWHSAFRLPLEVNEPGRRTEYTYDANGNRLTQTITDTNTSESRTTTYTYTAQGLLSSIDGSRSDVADVTKLTYDAQGNLTSITNALNQVTQITSHDAHGNPLSIVDPNGVTTTLAYDLRQRLLSRTVAGATTGFDYDDAGNLQKLTLPTGTFISYSYDAVHRLTDIADNLGNRIHYTLDDAGNRTAEKIYDPGNNLKRQLNQEYDSQSRLKKILGANGQVTQLGYDAQGNRTSSTEAGSFVTGSQYDALDRVFRVTDAANGETTYTYNALDQLTSVTDPKGLVTSYAVNAFGEVTQQSSPDTGVTRYTYDKAGNRKSQTDARGITVNYSYDALNRITQQDYPGTSEDVTYFYDGSNYGSSSPIPAGTANGVGRLTGVTDQSGSTSRAYDPRGTVREEARIVLNLIYRTRYSYDVADRLTGITYPNGRTLQLERNPLGQVTRLGTELSGTVLSLAEQLSYLPFGPEFSASLGNGLISTRTYDQDYRITQIQAGTLQDLSYYYDSRNNIDAIQDNLNASRSQNLGYDALSRLTQAQGSYGNLAYTYDTLGNRLTETDDGVTDTYTYSSTSHRLNSISGGRSMGFGYDAAGNTTQKGDLILSYNQANRLSQVSGRRLIAQYTHNVQGQRVLKQAGRDSTVYHYDQDGLLIAETDIQGKIQKEYIYLNGEPLVQFAYRLHGQKLVYDSFYYHRDHLGTPQLMSDAGGRTVWRADYEPFGLTTITADKKAKAENNKRLPGQYSDPETGLYQNWHRDYDPNIGRYIESDPIGLAGGIGTYVYALQNPLRFIDPLGLRTCVLVTRGPSGIANHSALFSSQGSEGGPFLYDPAGAYARANGGGSGDLIDNFSASIEGFTRFHRDNYGDITESVCKETTKEEEEKFLSVAEAHLSASAFGCASAVSDVIGGSRSFPNVERGTFLPGNLIKDARRRR